MAPARVDLADRVEDPEERERLEEEAMERFEKIGYQIMHRSGGGMMDANPFAATLGDRDKRQLVAGLLGQAFVIAWTTVRHNKAATEEIADRLVEAGELYGEDVTALLERVGLERPDIDVLQESTWPAI
jgi:hypothetical protein